MKFKIYSVASEFDARRSWVLEWPEVFEMNFWMESFDDCIATLEHHLEAFRSCLVCHLQ